MAVLRAPDPITCQVPVLLLAFNRPEHTLTVFERIREVRPPGLYFAVDGPRRDVAGDVEACRHVREIAGRVDWQCEVHTRFRPENLGLKHAVSDAIDWFFEHADRGIILEDDCLAEPTFFWFCGLMLERFADDERVMHVTGNNFQFGERVGRGSHYFSRLATVWGWATWRRAWRHYRASGECFERFGSAGQMENAFHDPLARAMWSEKIGAAYRSGSSWAFPWVFSVLRRSGLCVVPNVNLVTNIGYGPEGVHARARDSALSNIPTAPLTEIRHPEWELPDAAADTRFSRAMAREQYLPGRAGRVIRAAVRSSVRAVSGDAGVDRLRGFLRRWRS